jgi:hypothetical protein
MSKFQYALQEKSASRKRGRPVYFAKWTGIGPSLTEEPEEIARFDTMDEARKSPAYSFSWTFFEVVEVPYV